MKCQENSIRWETIMDKPLSGKVAVVTGGSRGIGKGIALSLGEAGATVYITGRTDKNHPTSIPLSGTVDETATEVTNRGGKGIAVRCDHRNDNETEALFERIHIEQGRLDILVNNAWAGYEGMHDGSDFPPAPNFWTRRLSHWDDNLFGVRAAYIASAYAARIMSNQKSGLIACVSHYVQDDRGNPPYHIAKTATDRLISEMAHDLREYNIASVSLYPGLVRTEGIMKHSQYIDLSNSESPEYIGRAVVALALDENIMSKTGESLWVSDLATEYNFTDVDGKAPIPNWKPK
jgi:dehydrogenase/reductase SDR family member 1